MPIIEATDISCQRGQYKLFKPVSFALSYGQSLLISGPNGIGKTTLLESIAGLRAISQGTMSFQGMDLSVDKGKWFDQCFFIGHKTGNKQALNCLENLTLFLQIQGIDVTQQQAEDALAQVGLAGYEYQFAGNLSAGQKKRLALARLLLLEHRLWILDEPFVNLDKQGCDWLLTLLYQHLDKHGILLISAHDNHSIRQKITQELLLEMAA